MFRHVLPVLLAVFISGAATAQQNRFTRPSGSFRAAVVKVDITPETPQYLRGYNPRLSTGVLDHLYHRIVVVDDGKTQFYLISTDVVGIPPVEYQRVVGMLKRKYDIDPLNVWWSTTHTHSAPEVAAHFKGIPYPSMADRAQLSSRHEIDTAYTGMLERKLINGVGEARGKLASARFGIGWGFSQANINRRGIDVDGEASLGLNPDGPTDRRIGLIRIEQQDGKLLVLIANYAMHGTVLGQESTKISGDAPGVVAEYVESQTGAPMLFINGAAGNMAPIYSVYENERAGHLSQFRVLLGDRILEANLKISATTADVSLASGEITVETPRREGLGWSPDLTAYSRTTTGGINLVRLPVRFLKINDDVALWAAPVEMFCEISNEIRARSPFAYTFYYGYTNGSLGYLPSADAWEHGGYEPSVSPFTPAAGKDVIEAVLAYLQGELRSK